MTYFNNPIFEFIGNKRQFGLNQQSSLDAIFDVFGPPEDGWEADRLLCYDDLEIGLHKEKDDRKIAYYGLYPGQTDGENFILPGKTNKTFDIKSLSIENFMMFFIDNRIEFSYDTMQDYDDEQRCLTNARNDEFYFLKKKGPYYLVSAFLREI